MKMELHHLKLKTGQDIICVVDELTDDIARVSHAIEIVSDPRLGMYTKKWLHLSEREEALINISRDVLFVNPASDDAVEMYLEVVQQRIDEKLQEAFGEHSLTTIH